MKFTLPKIYPITDTRISRISHLEQVRRLIAGGARLIQLREKHAPAGDFYDAAVACIEYAHARDVRIIINDRVDIAVAAHADGVHLGQDDLAPNEARRLTGGEALIGFSTHTIEQAQAAIAHAVDYIAIGPIFGTTTKTNPDPVVGLDGLAAVRNAVGDFPLVAIGGITRYNARSVLDAGADCVAVISDLLSDPARIESVMRELNNL